MIEIHSQIMAKFIRSLGRFISEIAKRFTEIKTDIRESFEKPRNLERFRESKFDRFSRPLFFEQQISESRFRRYVFSC